VYARTEVGSFVLPARCPHRGGPLNLATVAPDRARLVCPWHGRATSFTKSLRSGTPAVRRGDTVTAVFPCRADSPYALEHRPSSPDLRRGP
jgi:nitrite reductase (NADH) small subunit